MPVASDVRALGERGDQSSGVLREHAAHQILGDVEGEHLHHADVRVDVRRTGAEEDAIGVLQDAAFEHLR